MATYSIVTLLRLWRQNEITVEQALGHTLQQLAGLTDQLTAVEKRLHLLEQTRPAHTSALPPQGTAKPQG